MLGLGVTLWQPNSFSPLALFANGERGGFWDATDLSAMWQDTGGTTPAAADQTVARIDDLSGNGHHFTQATPSARPILRTDAALPALEYDGTDDSMSSVTPASDWAWVHQQGGVTIGVAATVAHRTDTLEFLIGTMSGASSTDTGVSLNSDNRDIVDNPKNARVQISRGVAGQVAASSVTYAGETTTKVWTYVTQASGLQLTGRDFTVSGGWINPTSTGDPTLTLFLGGAGTSLLQGRMHAAVVIDRVLDSGEEALLRRWLEARAGI